MHARAHAVAGRAAVDAFKPDHGLPESAVNVIDPHARGSGCRRSIRPPPLNPKEGLLMAGTTRLIVLLVLLGGWLGAVVVLSVNTAKQLAEARGERQQVEQIGQHMHEWLALARREARCAAPARL
jgi:hypothetical protein